MAELVISQQFKQFTDFAADALRNGDTKAIARQGNESEVAGVMQITSSTDDKVFAIEGPDVATFADLSTDGVHLDSAGADAVAKRLIERLSL